MQQNLKAHGGLLDEVIFIVRTDDVEDLAYLEDLLKTSSSYSRHNLADGNKKSGKVSYGRAWEVVERGTMYIKIDDDIVSETFHPLLRSHHHLLILILARHRYISTNRLYLH